MPFVVEVERDGKVRAVGPVADTYKPSDAQIAYALARFIENVRSLSIDPVVVRQNWLRAYDFVTDHAAVTLNEHARENDPFANVGRLTVAVEVTSVVRASPHHQIRFQNRAGKDIDLPAALFQRPARRLHSRAQGAELVLG